MVSGGLSLADVIVEYGAGHLAFHYVLNGLGQSVNAYDVDVLAHFSVGCLDCGQSAQSHSVVVTEHNVDLVAKLSQGILHDLLALSLIPVASLLQQFLNLYASVGQSLHGILGSVLSVYVLGIALNHDVGHNAVAVGIAVVLKLCDLLALEGAGLSCVSANVCSLDSFVFPSLLFSGIRSRLM